MNSLKEAALTAAMVIGPFGLVAALMGTSPELVSGRLEYGWQEVRGVGLGDAAGRRLDFAEGHGRYAGNGGDILDGAKVTIVETVDTVAGLGSIRGYLLFEKDGSTALARWTATVTTAPGRARGDAQSVTGSWTLVLGTGTLSAASGQGMLQGHRLGGRTAVTLTGSLGGREHAAPGSPAVATSPDTAIPAPRPPLGGA